MDADRSGNPEPQIDPERQRLARNYARTRRWLYAGNLVISAAYVLAFLFPGLSLWLRTYSAGLSSSSLIIVACFFLVFFLAYEIITLPLSIYGGYVVSRRYGLSTQNFAGWLADWLKGLGIGLFIALLGVEVAYYLLAVLPDYWWLVMAVVVLAFTVVMANLAPIILVPLFFKMTPITDEALAERLKRQAERAGTKVRGVYHLNLSAKTTAANAALMGLGNTRRIVLGDTLLDNYTPDEIEVVFAHELGHQAHGDISKSIALQSGVTLVSFFVASLVLQRFGPALGFASVADIANLPLLALALGLLGLITMPLINGFTRNYERQADVYALESTNKPRAMRNAMVRLANQNLAVLDPGRLIELIFYDHPAIGKRIEMAERFQGR